jgi:hypothetical protein
MGTIIQKIKEVSLISKEIKEIEKQDATTDSFSFRKECYEKIKNCIRRKDLLINEVKDKSLFLLKNRLGGSILMGIIPNGDYFHLLNDVKYYNHHTTILNVVNKNHMIIEQLSENDSDIDLEDKIELLNIGVNLSLIDEVINFYSQIRVLDDETHEFLYEEVGYNLCNITNKSEKRRKLNKDYQKYNKSKKLCFELFSKLDKVFFKINKREPKNTEVENLLWE